ncbi:MAG: hypothetical protein HC788_09180 [Sphingopyxis sp.]|nr:hypothetical protein [Sphingopyxis sp.]
MAYAIGMDLARNLIQYQAEINPDKLYEGMTGYSAQSSTLSPEVVQQVLTRFQDQVNKRVEAAQPQPAAGPIAVGMQAPELALPNPSGDTVRLSSLLRRTHGRADRDQVRGRAESVVDPGRPGSTQLQRRQPGQQRTRRHAQWRHPDAGSGQAIDRCRRSERRRRTRRTPREAGLAAQSHLGLDHGLAELRGRLAGVF